MRQEIKLRSDDNPISIVATDNQGVEGIQALQIRLNLPTARAVHRPPSGGPFDRYREIQGT